MEGGGLGDIASLQVGQNTNSFSQLVLKQNSSTASRIPVFLQARMQRMVHFAEILVAQTSMHFNCATLIARICTSKIYSNFFVTTNGVEAQRSNESFGVVLCTLSLVSKIR